MDWYQNLYDQKFSVTQLKNENPNNLHQRKYSNDSIFIERGNPNKRETKARNGENIQKASQFRKLSLNP